MRSLANSRSHSVRCPDPMRGNRTSADVGHSLEPDGDEADRGRPKLYPLHMRAARLVVVFTFAAGAASAQDAGVPVVCGALDDEGACFGETAGWCSGPNENGEGAALDTRAFDCAAHGATCVDVGGIGAWCVAPAGAACALDGETRVAQLACGSGQLDLALGCDLEEGCRAASVPCPPAGSTACANDTLVLSCASFGQPLMARCLGACADGRCVDQPVDAICDDVRLTCAEGLTCGANAHCEALVVDEPSDEEPDRRAPFETGGCRTTGSPSTTFALGLLLGVLWWRRGPGRSLHLRS